jgi:hypothetical protein
LRDADTGELLKVGKSEVSSFVDRFRPYLTAQQSSGRRLEVDAFAFHSGDVTPELIEKQMRKQLESTGYTLPWDNTSERLNRPGPGVPGTRLPRKLREQGYRWEDGRLVKD